MPVEYIKGDLFNNRFNVQAFAHGCNCKGSMGAGIAVQFKERYPDMYTEYRRRCKADPREFNPGDAFFWAADDDVSVFNLATQEHYRGKQPAKYEWVEQSLRAMRTTAEDEEITTIAMPRIAAGLGGLSWEKVRAIIDSTFEDWLGTLYVYEEYIPE